MRTTTLPGTGPGAGLGVGERLDVVGGGKGTVEDNGPGTVELVTVHTNFEARDGGGGDPVSQVSLRRLNEFIRVRQLESLYAFTIASLAVHDAAIK